MTEASLRRMLTGIADFYRGYPETEAVEGVAAHIRSFWDPRMRRALSGFLEAAEPGLDPLALKGAQAALAPIDR
jgi:formate dehydrogenase subunit delta